MAKDHQNQNTASVRGTLGAKKRTGASLPINLFDIVVVIVVAVAIIIAINGTQLAQLLGIGAQTEHCTVEYMIMFSDVDQDLALAISEGAQVYGNDTSTGMGTVISAPEVQNHRDLSYVDGVAQMKEKPGSVDITVTVRASAEYIEGEGYTVGDSIIRVGGNLSLRFPGYTGVGSCINLERTSD